MTTIDLANGQKRKKEIIASFLDGLAHVPSNAPGLQSYHAARGTVNGNLRVGVERRLAAVRKALKQFNVTVTLGRNTAGDSTVRLHSAIKQTEIFL